MSVVGMPTSRLPAPALLPPAPQNLKGKQHFTSLHGKVGLCTFTLALAAPLLGALSFRRLGLIQRFPEPWQPVLKWLHRLVGGRGVLGRRAGARAGQGCRMESAAPQAAVCEAPPSCLGSHTALLAPRACRSLPMRTSWAA